MSERLITLSEIMRCLQGCADLLEAIEYNLGTTSSAASFQKQVACLKEAIGLQEAAILNGHNYPIIRDEAGIIKVGGDQREVTLTDEQVSNIENFGIF